MYVCLCRGVTDGQIREALAEGESSVRELRHRLGVASQCGKCARCVLGLIRERDADSGAQSA